MQVDLAAPWSIGPVEIPGRIVLAPMAGVSVQAFRRQGRRYGAGLVCSEMVSCAGLQHGNERTLGYLRIASDEHPLAVQIFGAEPGGDGRRGPDGRGRGRGHRGHQLRLPGPQGDEDRAPGRRSSTIPTAPARIVEAVAEAVEAPVTVKMRRGLENGSRAALDVGPKLVEAGAAALTLHPRSAKQMYTGTADHSLTRRARRARGRPRDRVRRHHLARARARGARGDRRGRGHGRPRGAGRPVDGRRDRRARRRHAVAARRSSPSSSSSSTTRSRRWARQRATGFLKKFYGWYLGRGRFPKPFKQELVAARRRSPRWRSDCSPPRPGAADVLDRLRAETPAVEHTTLDLPVSIYAGG